MVKIRMTLLAALVAAAALGAPAMARAEVEVEQAGAPKDLIVKADLPTRAFWMPRLLLYLALGPLQGAAVPGIQYHHELQRSDNILFDKTYVQGGVDLVLNPTMVTVRPSFEILPIAFLRLQIGYMGIGMTGLSLGSGHSLSFPTAAGPFDATALEARPDDGEALFAHRATFNAMLRLKFGPIVVLSETELALWYVPAGRAEQQWFYDSFDDNLVRRGAADGTVMNRTLLLAEVWRADPGWAFMVGAVNHYTKAFAAGYERDRLGLALVLNAGDELWDIDRPQVVLMGGVALMDHNRRHDPYGEIAIRMHWDLVD
jgi:hypothetical protein